MITIEYIKEINKRFSSLELIAFATHGLNISQVDEEAIKDNAETDIEILKTLEDN